MLKTQIKYLLIVFSFICYKLSAQDLIVKKDGTKLYCKIIAENPKTIFYIMPNQSTQVELDKTEVDKYVFEWLNKNNEAVASKTNTSRNTTNTNTLVSLNSELFQIDLNAGVSVPVSDYGDNNINNDNSGLANTGFIAEAKAILKFSKFIGVSCGYFSQSNPFDDETLLNDLKLNNPGVTFTVNSTNWNVKGLLIGIQLFFPLDGLKNTSMFINAQGGIPRYTLPEVTATGRSAIGGGQLTLKTDEAKAPVYIFGLGLQKKISNKLAYKLSANFLQGKAEFKNVVSVSNGSSSPSGTFNQRVPSLNISAALVFLIE